MLVLLPTTQGRPYRILFEHRPHYLYVRVQAETTSYAVARQYWVEIFSMQRRREYHRILLDKDIPESLPTHDVVMLVSEIAKMGCHDVKFAILDRNYDQERCGFEEMVGTNRGLKVKICGSADEATTFLTDDAASLSPIGEAIKRHAAA